MKKIKRMLATLMAVIMVLTAAPLSGFVGLNLNFDWLDFNTKASAATYSGTCGDNLTWILNESSGNLTISGIGAMTDYYDSYGSRTPWNGNEYYIKTVVIDDGVTSIGSYAFYNCTELTNIAIPDSVQSIGGYAFYKCTALTEITIPNGVTSIGDFVFYNCSRLSEINIPDSVLSVGHGAFSGCSNLNNISIPVGTTSIGHDAFYNCSNLNEINVPDSVTNIGRNAFYNTNYYNEDSNWENGVLYIGKCLIDVDDAAITENYSVKDGTKVIACEAFAYCSVIKSVSIPDSVVNIGESTFYGCYNLTDVNFGNGITEINEYTFVDCSALERVELPDAVKRVGYRAFYSCSALNKIELPDNIIKIENEAFYNTGYYNSESNWENNVLYIGEYLIRAKVELFDIYTIKDGTKTVADYAFSDCNELTGIIFPASLISIGEKAFAYCTYFDVSYYKGSREQWYQVLIPEEYDTLKYGFTRFVSESGKCGNNIEWLLDEYGSLVVIGTGNMTNYSSTTVAPWDSYKDEIKSISIYEGVTSIGNDTFVGCENLTYVYIPNTVTKIGNTAFRDCTSLASISIPNSVTNIGYYAFYGCTALTSLTITEGVTTIGNHAFRKCSGLTTVIIPDTVTNIAANAFYDCSALENVYYAGTQEQWDAVTVGAGNEAITENIILATTVTGTCGTNLNWYLINNEKLIISGSGAMTNYSSSNYAPWYSYASFIKKIVVENGVSSISNYAFVGCSNVTEIVVPISVDCGCNYYTFYDCNSVQKVTLTKGNGTATDYDWGSYSNTPWQKDTCTEIIIQDGVTEIGNFTFYECGNIKTVVISDSVTSIGSEAFFGCSGLSSITIPDKVTKIGGYAFAECSNLSSVQIGKSVAFIGTDAFSNINLIDVYYTGSILDWINIDFISYSSNPMYNATGTLYINGNVVSGDIVIPDGTTQLNCYAFYGLNEVESVTIPESVTYIYGGNSWPLTDNAVIYYEGEKEQWDAIEVPQGGIHNNGNVVFDSDSENPYFSGECGENLDWKLHFDGNLVICGTGVMYSYSSSGSNMAPWNKQKNIEITSVTIEGGVTSIGTYAFYGCSYVSKINLSDSVASIGQYAFANCSSLTQIIIPYVVNTINSYTFLGCTSLQMIEIPESVTSIGSYAFKDVSSITEIIVPDSVTSIGNGAFKGMDNLETITLPFVGSSADISSGSGSVFGYVFGYASSNYEGITRQQYYWYDDYMGDSGYNYGYYYIPKTIKTVTITKDTTIPYGAFYGCSFISEINLPDDVTSIDEYAFYNCSSLAGIDISDGVESIGKYTFYGCSLLESIELPESVNSIGEYAFDGCSSLTEIRIPEGVESIGRNTFYACASLETIELPASLKSIGYEAFAYTSIKELVIPKSVTNIDNYILEGNSDIEKLTVPFLGSNRNSTATLNYLFGYSSSENYNVPKSLKTVNITNASKIGNYAFRYCSIVENITLNEGITSIGSYAFYSCSSLKEITIPDTVTNISDCAFNSCTAMKTVDLGNNPNLQINYNVFDGCDSVESYLIGSSSVNYCTDEYGVLYNKNKSGLIRYPTGNSRTEYTVDSNVSYINENAFENCIYLKNVNLPKDIISIGEYAFRNCTVLEKIIIPDGTYTVCHGAFEGCTSLKEITIPESLTDLANYAFSNCTAVEKIYYNASDLNAEEYKDYIFVNCGRDTEGVDVIFGDTVINIPSSLFTATEESYWHDSDTEACIYCGGIGYHDCYVDVSPKLKSVTIGKNVENIGSSAFYGNETLTDLYFNATSCVSANGAFNGCAALTNVAIGEGVVKIPSYFITNCDTVVDIVIPKSVTVIGNFAFSNNDGLETVRFNSTGEIIIGNDILQASYKAMICCKENSYMHSYAMINGIKFAIVDGADNPKFEIKNDVLISYKGSAENVFVSAASKIGFGAFKGNETLKSVELSSGVDRIFGSAFADCINLEKIIIPQNVSSIGDGAFTGCEKLTIWCYAGSYAESYAISNNIPVEYITLNIEKKVIILNQDETTSVNASFNTTLMDDVEITWTSSNPSVASVNSSGVITALSTGEATVTATTSNGLSASCDVRVTGAGQVYGVALGFNVTLNKREEVTITPNIDADEGVLYTISYLSSDTSVATVNNDGKIIAVSAGTATITCTVTDENGNTFEASIVVVVNNSADNFELSDDEIYITIGSIKQLTGIITPDNVVNKEITWESTNTSIATVDENGNVKGIMAGTAVIVATTKDGGLKDYCIVKVVGVEALSTATIDHEKGIITGLSSNMSSLDSFIEISDPSCSVSHTTLGTESIVYIERGEEIVDAYTIVIFGDVNGDGWYDGQDAVLVSCLANGMLTKDDVSEAVYMAADCNHDGVIDESDVAILNEAGMLLTSVDQSKPAEVLIETSSAYVEYLDLIDQSPEIEIEGETEIDTDVDTDESPEADIESTTEQDEVVENESFIEMIMNILKSIFEMLIAYIPVPLK